MIAAQTIAEWTTALTLEDVPEDVLEHQAAPPERMRLGEARRWISAIASCARRRGRNPYEHGWKPAS